MIRVLGTVFAGLLGLAFGSFLNVCLSRWPEGESVVKPRSHCRGCGRVLKWWENVPLVSWVALRGRCRGCGAWIGWRYVIVEAAVGGLWAFIASQAVSDIPLLPSTTVRDFEEGVALAILSWLLVALAVLDAENLWLPNFLTIPGACAGLLITFYFQARGNSFFRPAQPLRILPVRIAGILAAAGLILLIRLAYWLIRHREGIGLGDAKLMALLAAWLGLRGALLAFAIGVILGAVVAGAVLAVPRKGPNRDGWGLLKLPLGTFLCIGGIVSGLAGQQIIAAYMRWAGF
jgi:leader peptidase (prepilin peptidase)/N-methyltransferase